MKCPICNQEAPYGVTNCPHCGYNLPKVGLSSHNPDANQYNYSNNPTTEVKTKYKKIVYYGEEETRPISAWGYVGYNLLYSIPVVGFIIWLVHVFSHANVNRRNYARSMFCAALLSLIISAVSFGVMALLLAINVITPEMYQAFVDGYLAGLGVAA